MNKTLSVLVLGLALSQTHCMVETSGCQKLKQPRSQKIEKPTLPEIAGIITHIDEDSFAIRYGGERSAGAANFEYEILFVESESGTLKLLAPQPTSYFVGEGVHIEYTPREEISFKEIVDWYSRGAGYSLQRGKINIDGVLEISRW